MARSVSVIIVTWNALEHLQTFLPSVAATEYDNLEVLIADNASTDGSAEWVRENFPTFNVVTLMRNFGYCGGNNRAADHANGEILLFLNNDVRVEPGWLEPIIREFEDPNVAAVQPKILSHTEPGHFEYAGAAGGYLDRMGYPFCRGRIFDHVERDTGQYDDRRPIFWASGAALAIRKTCFMEAGRFDDTFEFHMEEIDLCWRLWNRGQKVIYTPESRVFHLGGGSLPSGSSRKAYFNFRNNLQMLWKNATTEWLKSRFFFRLLLDGVAAFHALATGHAGVFGAIFRAHMRFYTRWPALNRQRKALQAERKMSFNPETMLDLNILAEHFLHGKKKFSEVVEEGEQLTEEKHG
ncbi:MAG: glycosyltransferase family 2 protein [Balneolaceae bacterium]